MPCPSRSPVDQRSVKQEWLRSLEFRAALLIKAGLIFLLETRRTENWTVKLTPKLR